MTSAQAPWPAKDRIIYSDGDISPWRDVSSVERISALLRWNNCRSIEVRLSNGSLVVVKRRKG